MNVRLETDTAKTGSNAQNATDGSHCSENTAVLFYRIYQLFKVQPFSTRHRCLFAVSLKPKDCHCFSRKNCFAESFVWFYLGTKPTDPTEDVICYGAFAVVNVPKLQYGICTICYYGICISRLVPNQRVANFSRLIPKVKMSNFCKKECKFFCLSSKHRHVI
jgi:hypothetical protein